MFELNWKEIQNRSLFTKGLRFGPYYIFLWYISSGSTMKLKHLFPDHNNLNLFLRQYNISLYWDYERQVLLNYSSCRTVARSLHDAESFLTYFSKTPQSSSTIFRSGNYACHGRCSALLSCSSNHSITSFAMCISAFSACYTAIQCLNHWMHMVLQNGSVISGSEVPI